MQTSDYQASDYIEANRRAWNQVAPIHAAINQERLLRSFAEPGYSVLDEYELAKLRQIGVEGKAVTQIGCNNGRELLSIKNLGAGRCVGFDLSEEFIKQARELNVAAQHDCEFVATSVYDIEPKYDRSFDLVYITIGVLSWMPDIAAFFAVVARLLKPQGQLMIYEWHPFLNMLDAPEEADDPLHIALSYFNVEATEDTTTLDYYEGKHYDSLPKYWFTHTMSALLMGIITNEITIASFEEYPHDISNLFKPIEHYQRVPLSYILIGQKQ